jgi:NitT/TauT family transport system ATP-binding protein
MENHIEIKGVSKMYTQSSGDTLMVLRSIDLNIGRGEFFSIVGASGCGKSTLLNLLAGFELPSKGTIHINGEVVTKPSAKFVTVFQEHGLFPWSTVLGNVLFALFASGVSKSQRKEKAMHYLTLVGLEKFARLYPRELSGGMKQRVAIARALSVEPEIIFMDEPFGALDALTRMRLQKELLELWQASGKTIVFVTHSIDEATFLSNRVAVMGGGLSGIKAIFNVPTPYPRDQLTNKQTKLMSDILFSLES